MLKESIYVRLAGKDYVPCFKKFKDTFGHTFSQNENSLFLTRIHQMHSQTTIDSEFSFLPIQLLAIIIRIIPN